MDNNEALIEYLGKLTVSLNDLGFDTDRTETFYALYLAVVHKNAVIRSMLSIQIEVMLANKKDNFLKALERRLVDFVKSKQHLILLPSTVKSKAERILLVRSINTLEASEVGKALKH